MSDIVSPFAPDAFPDLPPVAGFTMATAEAGVKYRGRRDLWVLRGDPGTQIAGVFTQNRCPGAPVDWSRAALDAPTHGPRLVVVNSGTANVFTGQAGKDAVLETAKGAADAFGAEAEAVQVASTGVIGVALDASKLVAQFPDMAGRMRPDGWEAAARAIMTTDTYPKGATQTALIGDTVVTLNGIAKGSGMIAPDMATMLAYVATDADLPQDVLQALLADYTGPTFNAVTVDSDTSTSDTMLLLASGQAEHPRVLGADDPVLAAFRLALRAVMHDLAQQIVRDGEGISKLMTVQVTGAVSDDSAATIAKSVANSPLVKTAVAGEDANWGRIVMAVGKAGEPAERDRLSIHVGPHRLARQGQPDPDYREELGASYMRNSEIEFSIDLGLGDGAATVWASDLTHRYIDINADYRS
ncbi:bifunctional glutamate N-acetyltransferase/amino-acid acetyltransferase ArgJ [uncultured Algimonas sp.]|uniref:bifunctional glutamate N-acetyltransferase/amino-acid acetyltransferase ArgJ n=1 Tax=uncultured Algimonas sp. TaxID=1547920 RepID=UPI00260F7EAF|nr:bifunctional glutamate N-acetyltransferase/amino-acid acetyltransferase ArgJ [uncultured Algimonas sp.]